MRRNSSCFSPSSLYGCRRLGSDAPPRRCRASPLDRLLRPAFGHTRRCGQPGKERQAVDARAGQWVDRVLGVGHEAHDVARLVGDAGDLAVAAVRVVAEVSHHNPAGGLQLVEGALVRDVAALAVLDRDDDFRAGPVAVGPGRDGILDDEPLVSADELPVVVAYQRAGQQVGFAEHLEAVAYAENRQAVPSGGDHRLHNRGEPSDRAAAQVIAVGESARKDDRVDIGQNRVGVPSGTASPPAMRTARWESRS